jgi:metal-sulfur cluster biosynthetic enzyme
MPELRELILAELDEIKDPCSLATGLPLGLAEMGLVREVAVSRDGSVTVELRLTSPFCHMIGFFKTEAAARIGRLPGVAAVTLNADNGLDWSPRNISPAAAERRRQHLERTEARTA